MDILQKNTLAEKQGIIIYQSKYGATRKYAKWLQEMTGFDNKKVSEVTLNEAVRYNIIVFCGGIYASGIAGLSFLKKNIAKLKDKRIVIFCVGASPYDEKAFEEMKRRNLKDGLEGLPLFYGRGTWDMSKMTFKDRTLCRMLQKVVEKKAPDDCEPWMKALICASGQACDWTDKSYLTPLLDYLKNLCFFPAHDKISSERS